MGHWGTVPQAGSCRTLHRSVQDRVAGGKGAGRAGCGSWQSRWAKGRHQGGEQGPGQSSVHLARAVGPFLGSYLAWSWPVLHTAPIFSDKFLGVPWETQAPPWGSLGWTP